MVSLAFTDGATSGAATPTAPARPMLPPAAILSLIAWFALVFAASWLMPHWADDWCRSGIENVATLVEKISDEYFSWTGRLAPTALTYFHLSSVLPHTLTVFYLINAGLFATLVLFLARLVVATLPPDHRSQWAGPSQQCLLLFVTGLAIWWLPASIGEVALWKTGAIGYLWGVALSVLLLERSFALAAGSEAPRIAWVLALAALGFVTATFLEPLSLCVLAALGIMALAALLRRRPGRWALVLVAAAHGLGTLALLVAPGNVVRAADIEAVTATAWREHWYWFLRRVFSEELVAVFAVLLICMAVQAWRAGPGRRAAALWALGRSALRIGLPFAAFVAVYLAVLAPLPGSVVQARRVGFPVSVALVGAAIGLLLLIRIRAGAAAALAIACLVIVYPITAWVVLRDGHADARIQNEWAAIIARDHQGPSSELALPLAQSPTGTSVMTLKHRFLSGFQEHPDYWANRCYARYIRVASVRGY